MIHCDGLYNDLWMRAHYGVAVPHRFWDVDHYWRYYAYPEMLEAYKVTGHTAAHAKTPSSARAS